MAAGSTVRKNGGGETSYIIFIFIYKTTFIGVNKALSGVIICSGMFYTILFHCSIRCFPVLVYSKTFWHTLAFQTFIIHVLLDLNHSSDEFTPSANWMLYD